MHYKAIIFDLDGTLLDTLKDLAGSANRTLQSLELPTHSVSSYRDFIGNGLHTLITRILPVPQRTEALIKEATHRFKEDYTLHWQDNTVMYDGISEMLDRLVGEKYSINILSNKPDNFTRLCVNKLLSRWTFDTVLGQRPNIAAKPSPMAALEIAKNHDIPASQVLFVGDSAVDIQTGCNAGMETVGVLWGFRSAKELEKNGATYLIEHPLELTTILHNPLNK